MTSPDLRPLVTALVPTYNGAAFIERTLDSLAAQTYPLLEILIGDDHSSDDTLDVVQRFAEGRANVRILQRDTNLGWLRNSNDLMGQARGELMFFAFHDDVVAPTYVETLVRALDSDEGAVLAFTDMEVHEQDGRVAVCTFDALEGVGDAYRRGRVMARRHGDWWVPNRGLFRASGYAKVGGIHPNQQGEYSADWTWLLALSLVGGFVRVPEVLCTKYYQSGSLSKTWPHDGDQVRALRRSGVAEIDRSSLPAGQRLRLKAYLWTRIYASRLPGRVKLLLRRAGA